MKKIKVIIGKNASGKSTIAKAMACSVKSEEKILLSEENLKSSFGFSECTEKTRVIIIDDLRNATYLLPLVFTVIDGVNVNKRGQKPFEIYPEMIIVCCEDITKERLLDMGSSISRRIEIIETIS